MKQTLRIVLSNAREFKNDENVFVVVALREKKTNRNKLFYEDVIMIGTY